MASKYSINEAELQHNQRVSDLAEEPLGMLMPIQGYEKKPLVSLEEAVEPIVSFVPDVKRMAHVAKSRCKKSPADNLSVDESASIMLYSMEWDPREECLYYVLNATLRTEDRNQLTPWFLFLKLLLTAIDRLPSSNCSVVFRGIKRDVEKEYPKGETVIWWGFSSCTATMDVLENDQFLGRTGTRTFFTIACTSGKDIRNHSYYQREHEILLLPGRQFQVVSCLNQPGGLHMIQLKETEPQYALLEPVTIDSKQISKATTSRIVDALLKATESRAPPTTAARSLSASPPERNSKFDEMIENIVNESEINWSSEGLTDNDMAAIAYYLLRDNYTLTQLDISYNRIGDEGARYLSEALQNNTTLTHLDLDNNQVGDKGAQYLCETLQNNTTLTELDLSYNRIGDEGAQYLSDALQNNTTLTQLDLSYNRIGDEGARYLSEALQNNTTLTQLHLDNNNIGYQGERYLQELKETNTDLDIAW